MREIHPYATDSSERDRWAIYLAIVSILSGWGIHLFIGSHRTVVPDWLWWVEIPGPITLYLFLRWLMDEWGWSLAFFHRFRLVRIPNLNGEWVGSLRSSNDGMATPYDCRITIRQTWTRIAVVLTTNTSRSQNMVAGILINRADDALLVYEFVNEPGVGAPETMNAFHGHATLRLEHDNGNDILTGEYYAGRGRQTMGTMTVARAR